MNLKFLSMKKLTIFLALLLFVGFTVQAQMQISGTVTGAEDGLSIPGLSVVVKDNSTIGSTTDVNGVYSLTVPSGTEALIFSFVGMKTQEVLINGRSVIDVQMEGELLEMDEVVVTALGISREKKSLGYATQSVRGEDITEAAESNLVNSLSGRISGVQVTNSTGAVGSSSRLILRGASSIYGDNQPLFVVDGVPISNLNDGTAGSSGGFDVPNGAGDINPNDIESINVLKGANASALYGIRAANGVVVINTKKGKESKELGIEINTGVTFESPLVLPDYQNSYGQGSEGYFEYINGNGPYAGTDESWGPPLDVGLEFMQFTSYINNPDDPQPEPWVSHPDNVKDFYETGVSTRTDVSFSGGSEKTTYRLGLGYQDQDGMIPYTDFNRYSVTGAGSHNFTDKFKTQFNVRYVKSNSDNLPSGGYDGSNVVQQTIWGGRQVDWSALEDYENIPKALPGSTFGDGIVPINWNTKYHNNPYWQLETNNNTFIRDRITGGFRLSYDLLDNLNLSVGAAIDEYNTLTTTNFAKGFSGDAPTYVYSGGVANRDGSEGYYDERKRKFSETNFDFLLSYNKDFGSDIRTSASIGGNSMHQTRSFEYDAIQINLPGLNSLSNVLAGSEMYSDNWHQEQAVNSLFGTAEVIFKNYLFLNLTGRNDWASVLPVENNSFFYPSVTLSAIVDEMFNLDLRIIDMIKLRGGWAKVGGFGPLASGDIVPVFELSTVPWEGSRFAEFPATLSNTKIKPQTTVSTEVGMQLNMYENRLRFDFTYYDATTTELILPVQVTRASGVRRVWDNVGELRNKGVEIQLGGTVLKTKDLIVDLELNFAKNNNEVIKAGSDDDNDEEALILGGQWNMNLEAREGYAYGSIVGPGLLRDDDGNVIYKNGLPQQTDENIVLGDIQPDWTGGIALNINYKGLSFSTLVDAKIGGEVYSMTNAWGQYAGILAESLQGRETGVVGDGVKNIGTDDNPVYVENDVTVPAEDYFKATYGNDIVETSVFDASYIKLRQVALGYSLPSKWFSSIGLKGAKISVIGRNLAILYRKAPHIDPETGFSNVNGEQGQEFGQLASARSIGFSINLKF